MLNLIPKEEKKKIVRSFYLKIVVLFLVMGSLSVWVVTISILPAYFVSSTKKSIANNKLITQQQEPMPIPQEKTLSVIKETNNKLKLIENAEKNSFLVSQKIIVAILSKKTPDIRITDISYENDLKKGRLISIQGIAPSREILLSFRQALEDDKNFKQVDLPVSNFVKGSDIQFYLSLMPS